MRILNVMLLLLLLLATDGAAQSTTNSQNPPVVVTSKKWQREYRNPRLEEDPLRASEQQAQWQRATIQVLRTNAAILRSESSEKRQLPVPAMGNAPRDTSGRISDGYTYQFKLVNTGPKRIVGVVWDFVFIDPVTKTEAGHHQFTSKTNIRAGKSRNLAGRSHTPPVRVINAGTAGRNAKEKFTEEVVILSIKYDDGSTWTR